MLRRITARETQVGQLVVWLDASSVTAPSGGDDGTATDAAIRAEIVTALYTLQRELQVADHT